MTMNERAQDRPVSAEPGRCDTPGCHNPWSHQIKVYGNIQRLCNFHRGIARTYWEREVEQKLEES